ACPVFEMEVTIVVYPQIMVQFEPLTLCATPTTPYVIAPEVTGGTGNYEYTWAPGGQITPSITVANPVNGTLYTVSVFDEVGCYHSATMVITVYETFPVDIIAPVTEQCLQSGIIDLDATASGGFDPYNFLWTLPDQSTETSQAISSNLSGEFLLEVTDSEGCVGKDSVDLLFHESPEVFIDALNDMLALCEGESTQLTGQASLGESPYYYEWTTPEGLESGKTITATYPGQYSITVTDANGCTAESDIAIEEQPSPEPVLDALDLVCNFDDDVIITVTEDFEDYIWSTGPGDDGEQVIDVFQAGTYSVTVTNEFGCTGSTEVTIDLFPQPNFPFPDTFEICIGSSITIDVDDFGGPWDNYIWFNCGNCGGVFDTEGSYSVQVFDDNGCTANADFMVLETASLDPDLQGQNVICTGNSFTISALPGFTSYDWSPNAGGATGNSVVVSSPGTYIVTVGDIAGCSGIDTLIVTSGDVTTSITGPTQICAGVQATLNAGAGFANYLWAPGGATTQTITVEEGTYAVTVTSSDGCTATATTTIIETPFVPVITGDDMICQTSETSTLDAGGPYTNYLWSTGGATTQTITVSAPGTYSVTITDLPGCVGTASFNVGNHPVPFVAITGLPDFCVGGQTDLSATAGFNYLWSTTETNQTISINTPGNVIVTVTDGNGCTNTANLTVNPPYQETVEITGSFVFCPGDQATLEVPAGYASVLWTTGQTSDQIMTNIEGVIGVTVTDTDGCIATDAVTTDENAILSPQITGDAAICDAGTAVLNAGPGFDNYVWAPNGEITQTISVNAPGMYTVTVSSNSGCMGTDDFVVIGQTSPVINVTSNATACNAQEPGGPTTIINFNSLVTGATGAWVQASGPSSVNLGSLTNVNFDGLSAGTYVFTFTSNTAIAPCTNVSDDLTVTITDCACPFIDLNPAADLCNDNGTMNLSTVIVAPTATNGQWAIQNAPNGSNPATITGSIFDVTNADNGTYTISYTLSGLPSYCTSSVTTTVNVLATPDAGNATAPASYCAGESQVVSLVTLLSGQDSGGSWVESSTNMSTGAAFNPVTGTFNVVAQAAGTYTFEYVVAGAGPCPDDVTTVEVVIENNPVADAGSPATLDCTSPSTTIGGPNTSTGNEFVYSWTTNTGVISDPNDISPIATAGGTYTLTVMNTITGCSATDQVIIDQNGDFPTDINIQVTSPDCEGDSPGSVQVIAVVGGTAPYTYSLNNAPSVTNPVFNNLQAGDYTLQITDASGCQLTKDFTIEELVVVDLDIVNYVNDTLIYAFGDTIKLSFLFSGTSDTPDSLVWSLNDSIICINCPVLEFVADQAGQITLQAFDVRGCEIERTISFLVVRDRDLYIPNVFSPNGDGINDFFTVFTDNDITVTVMEIYTRWGDLVYKTTNLAPNTETGSWDGRFRGDRLNPGVYVYRLELLHGDGLVEKLAGDVTIVR
ncbi:MAG: gliding motility-associated C-terminal domain-containing protein, partial [Bacteroidota bacterium]|nr:gliding motility-associated C-terminal domain-containing protein [Bacteroidota bacterium]